MLLNKTQKIYCHVVLLQTSFNSLFCSNLVFWEDFQSAIWVLLLLSLTAQFPIQDVSGGAQTQFGSCCACFGLVQAHYKPKTCITQVQRKGSPPPLLGMLKNHQKATDIQNFDENSFFFPPKKVIKFHPF